MTNHPATASKRLFYALWPEADTRRALHRLQQTLALDGRPVPAANLHITLAFLGQQDSRLLPVLQTILRHLPPAVLDLTLDRIGYFPRHRIAWIGMQQRSPALDALQQALDQQLLEHGISYAPSKDFQAHVTLARGAQAPRVTACPPLAWAAREIALLESMPQADGAHYQVLALHRLDGSF